MIRKTDKIRRWYGGSFLNFSKFFKTTQLFINMKTSVCKNETKHGPLEDFWLLSIIPLLKMKKVTDYVDYWSKFYIELEVTPCQLYYPSNNDVFTFEQAQHHYLLLTLFTQLVFLFIPWKHQTNSGFLMFPERRERNQWHEIVYLSNHSSLLQILEMSIK